jgi:hypothetical protein
MIDAEEENWRDRDESLEFAVLEAATVERARKANFCMKKERGTLSSEKESYLSDRAEATCLRGTHFDDCTV